jgi:hypothetical protein
LNVSKIEKMLGVPAAAGRRRRPSNQFIPILIG